MIIKKHVVVFVFLLLLFGLSACKVETSEVIEPVRPDLVPVNAMWVGGIDGGFFVLVTKPPEYPETVFYGEVYYVSGDVAYKGKLRMFPEDGAGINIKEKHSFEGWDGDTLYLINDHYLKIYE